MGGAIALLFDDLMVEPRPIDMVDECHLQRPAISHKR
jgi:hypothetical protein